MESHLRLGRCQTGLLVCLQSQETVEFVACLCDCMSVPGLPEQAPQTRWLKTTEMYSFTVWAARSLKAECQQGPAPSGELGKGLSQAPVLASRGFRHSLD